MKKLEPLAALALRQFPTARKDLLLEFLRDWLAWATTEPLSVKYCPSDGLCFSVITFLDSRPGAVLGRWADFKELDTALEVALLYTTHATEFPFGKFNYQWRSALRRQHKCRKRLAWVRAVIEVLEEQ